MEYRAKEGFGVRLFQGVVRFFAFWAIGYRGPVSVPAFLKADHEEERKRRDKLAQDIVGLARDGLVAAWPFGLFLRSFSTDGEMVVHAADSPWMFLVPSGEYACDVDLETALIDALWTYVPVVALDSGRQQFGAGRAQTSDDGWQAVAEVLIEGADTIIVVPGVSPGLSVEYKLLRTMQALDKTIFVIPPCEKKNLRSAVAAWNQATRLCADELQVQMPEYTRRGALFTLSESGTVDISVPFPKSMSTDGIRDQLEVLHKRVQRRTRLVGSEPAG